ncbi:MAG: hypothetical protein Q9207_003569 [Kuettlingeria erythrocarpa]
MPKRPSNHPKTDPRTGLDWWASHLQHESRADDRWDYYEAYDDLKPHQYPAHPPTANARLARKLAERHVPGTDAWIEAQVEQRKKTVGAKAPKEVPNAATPSKVRTRHQHAASPHGEETIVEREQELHEDCLEPSTTFQPSSSHLHPDEDDHEEQTTSVMEETNDRRWRVVLYAAENIVAMTPPANPTIEDWRQILDWEPEGTVLYDALYVRELWLGALALNASEEWQHEVSSSLLVRLPTTEFEELRRAVQDNEAE